MLVTREEGLAMVQEAETYINTPWIHAQRVKGVGVDCVGLFICVMQGLGYTTWDAPNYSRYFDPQGLKDDINKFYDEVQEPQPGDLILFRFGRHPKHVGMYINEEWFIHAYESVGKVTRTRLDSSWRDRIVGFYRWRAA